GHDIPPVGGSKAITVWIHDSVAVGDYVIEEPVGRVAELRGVVAGGMREAAMRDVAVTVAGNAVAGCAVDVELLAAALERSRRVHGSVARWRDHSAPAARALGQRTGAVGESVGLQRARGAAIGPEGAVCQRIITRLVVHILDNVLAAAQQRGR